MKTIFTSGDQKKQFTQILSGLLVLLAIITLIFVFNNSRQLELAEQAENERQIAEQRTITNEIVKIATGEVSDTSSHFVAGDNGVLIEQQEVGNAVIIHTVILERPSFIGFYITEREDTINTSPLLPRGIHRIVSIAAPETLTKNTTYSVVIHPDLNDDKTFDQDTDRALTNSDGEILRAEFTAS